MPGGEANELLNSVCIGDGVYANNERSDLFHQRITEASKMNKFKVGDTVEVINCELNQPITCCGAITYISEVVGLTSYRLNEVSYLWEEYQLKLIPEHKFAALEPEPEVAKSQQYLADRLSEIENSEDEHWLGAL
jgi:hypothetical protein